jgi:hypothetical protein
MATYYDTAIVPARPMKPRDKAKVEVAVQVATRWIIAKLRNAKFFSLAELNEGIRDCVTALNDRVSRHLGSSRRALFRAIEQSALKSLPAETYVYAEWKECKAGIDCHVEVEATRVESSPGSFHSFGVNKVPESPHTLSPAAHAETVNIRSTAW